ncbi:MAG: CynX/NimT family MFS transporter [Haloferacaceae archaeon]
MARAAGRAEYLLLGLGALGYTCYTFVWFTLPALLSPVISEFGLSTTQAGVVVGAVPLVYIPLGLASGLLIDRVGARTAIGIGLVGFGLVQIARGIAGGFLTLLVPTLVLGALGTGITFGLPKLVAELFPPERTGTMSSVYQVGSSLGSMAAFGLARPVLEPVFGGWRPIFLATGVVVLGYAAVWIVAVVGYARLGARAADGDAEPGAADAAGEGTGSGTPDDRGEAADGDGAAADDRGFTVESARRDLVRLFSHRDMRLLVVVGTMYLFVNHGLRGWLAVVLEGTGLSPDVAGLITSLLVGAQIAGTVTIPPLSDRWGRRRGALGGCGLLCAAGTAGLLVGPGALPAVVAMVALTGLGLGGLSPMIKTLPVEMDGIGPALTATAVSFVYAVGEIGGFAGPFVLGALRDATGGFAVGLAALVAAGLVIVAASASMSRVA